ncbi:hypothetical protein ACFYY8_31405 [Streptosporangium sp. NPDC001559]|uniref:hypothetical protein n=1 Tax=Streptosporangium sp. NPDC001559 TaxID=3366187 RepID=UPI0036EE4B96
MADSPRRYQLDGEVVEVLVRPNQKRKDRPARRFALPAIGLYAPVNVLVRYPDGTKKVRPFRGLRRLHDSR